MIISFLLQTLAIVIAAALVQTKIVSKKPEDPFASIHGHWSQLGPLALLAFQAAGQIVTSRKVELDALPTLVLTTALCDLVMDPHLFVGIEKNTLRNKRAAMIVSLILGAMTSGGIMKTVGIADALWVACALKAAITIAWILWKKHVPLDDLENNVV